MIPDPHVPAVDAVAVDGWLHALGIVPLERVEREGVTSWDLRLDARRRFDIRVTVILDPDLALIVWVHYAPLINDSFRASYQRLLRWNDTYPFAKFSLTEDGRPALSVELPVGSAGPDELGLAVARLLALCDLLLDESAGWIWIGGTIPSSGDRVSRQVGLLARYADRLADLAAR